MNCIISTIIHQNSTIFKTIDDETTLSGQKIVGALQARKIAQEQAIKQTNLDIQCLRNYETACKNGTVTSDDFTRIMGKASVQAQEYSKNIKEGTGSAQIYADKQETLKQSIQNTGTASKVAAIGVKALSIAGNMLAGMAISFTISKVIEGIKYLTTASERAIEKTKELQQEISQISSDYESERNTLTKLKDEYDSLTSKIGENGAKASLSADEYERYRDITSEILGITPKLITGWDEEGRAISNKNNLLQMSIDLLDEEYQKSLRNSTTKSKNEEIAAGIIEQKKDFDNSGDTKTISGTKYDLVWKDLKDYVNKAVTDKKVNYTYKSTGVIGKNDADAAYAINEFVYGDSLYKATELNTVYGWLGSLQERITSSQENFEKFANSLSNEDNPIYQWFTNEQIDELIRGADEYFQELARIEGEEQEYFQQYKDQLNLNARAVGNAYNDLEESTKSNITSMIDSFDYNDMTKEKFSSMATDLKDFVNKLSTDKTLLSSFNNLYNPQGEDESIEDYETRVKTGIDEISKYCKENYPAIKLTFGDIAADIEDLKTKYNTAISKFVGETNDIDLGKFFKDNSINDESEIDYWNKVTDGAKTAEEAIRMYERGLEENNKDLISYNELFSSSGYGLDDYQDKLSKVKDALTKLSSRELSYNDVIDLIQDKDLGLDPQKIDIESESFNGLEKELQRVADEGLQKVIDAIGDVNQYKDPEAVKNWINALKELNTEATEAANALTHANRAISSLDQISSRFDTLGSTYVKLKSGEELDFSDFSQLRANFGDLGSFDEFINSLLNAKSITSNIQEMYNKIATEFMRKESEVLGELDDKNKNIYIEMLKKLGIDNSEEVVDYALNKSKEVEKEVAGIFNLKTFVDRAIAYSGESGNASSLKELEETFYSSGLLEDNSLKDKLQKLFDLSFSGELNTSIIKADEYAAVLSKVGLSADSSNDDLNKFINMINSVSSASISSVNNLISEASASDTTKASLAQLIIEKSNFNSENIKTTKDIEELCSLANTARATTADLENLARAKALSIENDKLLEEREKVSKVNENENIGNYMYKKERLPQIDYTIEKNRKEIEEILNKKIDYEKVSPADFIPNVNYNGTNGSNGKNSNSESKQDFDWIERALAKIQDKVTDLERTAGNAYTTFSKRNNALIKDISAITEQIDVQKQAVNAYKREMNELGLSQSDIDKIKNGTMDIETIKDSDRAEKIQKYMSYYDKVISLENEIADKEMIEKLSKQKQIFDNIAKEYELKITQKDNDITNYSNDTERRKTYKKYDVKQIDSNYNKIEKQELAKAQLYADEISELQNQLNNNGIPKYSEEWYNMTNTIAELTEKQKECYNNIANYAKENFNDIATYYDNLLTDIQSSTNSLNNSIELISSSGHIVQATLYKQLANNTMEQRKTLVDEKNRLQTELNEMLKTNKIEEGSSDWYELKGKINDVDNSIQDCDKSLIEFYNNIIELEYANFERIQTSIQRLNDEAKFYLDLLNDRDLFNSKTGEITSEGLTYMGLLNQTYQTYLEIAKNYDSEISKINEKLANDPNNQELIDKKYEYIKAQRETILNAENEKQSIIDLAKQGYDAYINSINETISKLKELNQAERSEYEYQKNITEKTKNINSLKKQLMAFEGNDSEEARAKIQQLTVSLNDANQDLEETQYDKYLSDQENMLDKLVSDMQEHIEELLKNTDQVLEDMKVKVVENISVVGETLEDLSANYGLVLSDTLNNLWMNAESNPLTSTNGKIETMSTAITTAINDVVTKQNAVNTALADVNGYLKSISDTLGIKYTEKGNGNDKNNSNNSPIVAPTTPTTPKTPTAPTTPKAPTTPTTPTTSKTPKMIATHTIKKGDTLWQIVKDYYKVSTGIWDHIYAIRDANPGVITDVNNIRIGTKIKIPKYPFPQYAKGTKGVDKDQLALIDELGEELVVRAGNKGDITALTKGSGVIPADLTANLMEWGKINPLDGISGVKVPQLTALNNAHVNSIENNVQVTLDLKNVTNANEFIKELQTNKRLEKVIQSITIDQLAGKNSLNKMKF